MRSLADPMSAVFGADVVRHITDYMNSYQREGLALIAAAATGEWSITDCEMVGFDERGIMLRGRSDAGELSIRVTWLRPVAERRQIRTQLSELVERALDELPASLA